MLFSLLLFVTLPTGEVHSFVVDHGMSRADCARAAAARNLPNAPCRFTCEGSR